MEDFNIKIKNLSKKLSHEIDKNKKVTTNKYNHTYNILYELIAVIIVGVIIGWQIDYLFSIKPLGLISCILFSFFSYIFKLYKS